jgi:hypothetical protein
VKKKTWKNEVEDVCTGQPGLPLGAIIGIAVGGVVLVVAGVLLMVYLRHRRLHALDDIRNEHFRGMELGELQQRGDLEAYKSLRT